MSLCAASRLLQPLVKRCLRSSSTLAASSDIHADSEATLYVHWPYCKKRCSYCNFNKYVSDSVDHERMKKCLVTETKTQLEVSGVSKIKSIFFGGGTPSLAEPNTMRSIIEAVKETADLDKNAEITIEVNPTSTEENKLRDFQSAGINRVSIGLQSLDEEDLKVLGRNHSVEDGLRCLETARSLFPGKTSADFIFGCPGHKTEKVIKLLEQLMNHCDDHISLYQLTLERGTTLFKQIMDRELYLPTPDAMADMYEAAVTLLEDNDLRRYEASNFARNKSAQSVHNKAYWSGTQYIGVGPGAHSRFTPVGEELRTARIQTLEPDPWMFEVEKNGHATRKVETLTDYQVLQELLYVGLRTTQGISHECWEKFCSFGSLEEIFSDSHMFKLLQKEGYLQPLNRGLKASSRGINLADGLSKELFLVLENYHKSHEENAK